MQRHQATPGKALGEAGLELRQQLLGDVEAAVVEDVEEGQFEKATALGGCPYGDGLQLCAKESRLLRERPTTTVADLHVTKWHLSVHRQVETSTQQGPRRIVEVGHSDGVVDEHTTGPQGRR